MVRSYGQRLTEIVHQRGPLCVGIDPHPGLLRAWGLTVDATGVERCARTMIEALGELVAVFKPQSAFFEAHGAAGVKVLERVLGDIRSAGACSVLDVKRGDLGSTMEAYAAAYLSDGSPLAADAITLSPYLGFGSLESAMNTARESGRGAYVLALTSNPEGPEFQHARLASGETVAERIISSATRYNAGCRLLAGQLGPVGLVVGATIGRTGIDLARFNGSILAPGIGAQGATAADLQEVFGPALPRVLPSTSRQLMAAGPDPDSLRSSARVALGQMEAVLSLG